MAAQESPPDVQSMLNSVIGTGKAAVHNRVGAAELRRFIEDQPGVLGGVAIDDLHGNAGEVGASSGIVLFTATWDTSEGRTTRDLVLRHAPGSATRLFYEYDLSRQFQVQRALQGSGAPVPEPLWLDADGRWLGVPGFVMVSHPGSAPHAVAFQKGPLADASPADRRRMLGEIMTSLVRVHRTDLKAAGLRDFAMKAPGARPLEKCLNWYWQTWEWVRVPEYERLVPVRRWLLENLPEGEDELVHGDSSLHNYLFKDNRLVAALDWEMSCVARAECDLALQTVSHELFAPPPGSGLAQAPSQEEWLAMYREAGGRPLRDFEYFRRFAALVIVVCLCGLQRNLPAEARAAQEPLLRPCWKILR